MKLYPTLHGRNVGVAYRSGADGGAGGPSPRRNVGNPVVQHQIASDRVTSSVFKPPAGVELFMWGAAGWSPLGSVVMTPGTYAVGRGA